MKKQKYQEEVRRICRANALGAGRTAALNSMAKKYLLTHNATGNGNLRTICLGCAFNTSYWN